MDVYDAKEHRIGGIDIDGTVYNASGTYMGRVDLDGLVFNKYDTRVGQVQDNGLVCLSNREVIAHVGDDGAIYQSRNFPESHALNQPSGMIGRVVPAGDVHLSGAAAFLFLGGGLFQAWPSLL